MAPMASMAPLLRKSSSPSSSPFSLLSRSMAFSNLGSQTKERLSDQMDADVPSYGISRPLSETLKELNWKAPHSFIKSRMEDGFSVKYVPWLYKLLKGEDNNFDFIFLQCGYIYRESSGAESNDDTGYGDPVQKAEAMAFRRPFARLGLVLLLYHGDMV